MLAVEGSTIGVYGGNACSEVAESNPDPFLQQAADALKQLGF